MKSPGPIIQVVLVDVNGNIVDSDNPLPIGAAIDVGDIEIGAVELKNDIDDTRAKVGAGASANGLRVTVATDDALHAKIGEVQASPTANTVLDRLKALLTGIVLSAGSAIIGKVGIDQTTPGTTNGVQVNAALPAGSAVIGQVTANAGTNLNTSALATSAQVGEVQASPTANTVLDRLKALLTGIVLSAGSAVVGKVGIDQTTPGTTNGVLITAGENHIGAVGGINAKITVSFTRPADTTQYSVGDLVANSTVAGSVVPMSFAVARVSGKGGMIRRIRLRLSNTVITAASFRLHLYSASPTPTHGDNVAWLTDNAISYVGSLDVTNDKVFTDGSSGNGVPNVGSEINFISDTLYGLLEARDAYTPASAGTFTVELEVLQN